MTCATPSPRRLGGTSNLWGGRCIPLDPVDFEPRPFVQGTRWPIGYDEIAPFYAAACRYATCGEAVFETPVPRHADDVDMSLSKLERSSNKPRFQVAHRNTLEASRLIDVRLGTTMVDCDLGENGRVAQVLVADAVGVRRRIVAHRVVLAAGGLETTRLLLAMRRQREGLFGGSAGPLGRFYMGHIIGEIADVTFADDAMDAAFDFFRDGHGSFVRRRLTPSAALQAREGLPNICFWPVVPPIADARHRSGALSAVALALSTPGLGRRLVPEAIRARHLGDAVDWRAHARNVALDLPRTSAFLATFVQRRYLSAQRISGYFVRNRARRYGLSYSSEQSPRADSRVILLSETDRHGLPRLSIDLRFHEEDAAAVARAHAGLAEWLDRRGLGTLEYRTPEATAAAAVLGAGSTWDASDRSRPHGLGPPGGGGRPRPAVLRRAEPLRAELGGLPDLGTGQPYTLDRRLRRPPRRDARRRTLLPAKDDVMHHAPRHQREGAGDHQSADEDRDHRPTVRLDPPGASMRDADRQHHQREGRQPVDPRERPELPDRVESERAGGDERHQRDSDPAERAVARRALAPGELDKADQQGRDGRDGMRGDQRAGRDERGEAHAPACVAESPMRRDRRFAALPRSPRAGNSGAAAPSPYFGMLT